MCNLLPQAAPSAAAQFAPAESADIALQNNAVNQAELTPPKTYQFDPYAADQSAAALSRLQVLNNQQALQERSPEAYAGQQEAIKELSGGVAGDDQFLRNEALKSGLEKGITNGSIGANSVTSPNSVGGVTAANVFGPELLNYRNQRAQQALGIASSLQPDAAINPGSLISAQIGSEMQGVQNQNDWQNYLNQLRFGGATNIENQTQQALGEQQAANNANTAAANARGGQILSLAGNLLGTGLGAGMMASGVGGNAGAVIL